MFKFYKLRCVLERDEEGIIGELNYRILFEIYFVFVFVEVILYKLI